MSFMCKAATVNGGQCRKTAVEGKDFCSGHLAMSATGEVKYSPWPTKVKWKNRINRNWTKKLTDMGVQTKQMTKEILEAKKAWVDEHAKKHGRNPDALRGKQGKKDSGSQVFGKSGLRNAATFQAFQQLLDIYNIVDICITLPIAPEKGRDGEEVQLPDFMNTLEIEFSNGEEKSGNEDAYQEILSFLASESWEYTHVWANPPKDNGDVIHTVNIAHRKEKRSPECTLRFVDGQWRSEKS